MPTPRPSVGLDAAAAVTATAAPRDIGIATSYRANRYTRSRTAPNTEDITRPRPAEQTATEATEAPAADHGFGEPAQDQFAQTPDYVAEPAAAQPEFAAEAHEHRAAANSPPSATPPHC